MTIKLAETEAEKKTARRKKARGRSGRARTDLVVLINGVLVGVGGVFVVTNSVSVTVVAAVAALILTVVIVLAGR